MERGYARSRWIPGAASAALAAVSLIFLLAPEPSLRAQPAPAAPGATPASGAEAWATVSFQNRPISTLRATLLGRVPRQRAESAARRIRSIVDSGRFGTVSSREVSEGTLILIGAEGILVVTPADVDSFAGETMQQARDQAVASLTLALREAQELRQPRLILGAIVRSLAYSATFFALLWLLFRTARRAEARLRAAAGRHARKLTGAGEEEKAMATMAAAAHAIVRAGSWVVALFFAHLWLTLVLEQFPYTRPWGEGLSGFLVDALRDGALAIVHSMPGLFFVTATFFATRLVTGVVSAFFRAVEAERIVVPGLHPDTAVPTRRIVVTVIWVAAVAVAYPFIPGSQTDAFKGISVLFGLMISLGSSGTVNQMAGGLTLMYSRAIKVGDYVQVRDIEGVVTSMNLLSVKIRTHKRVEVSIPNTVVISTETKNFSRLGGDEGVILHTSVTIGYGAPWRQVHALLIMAAERTPGLKKEPPPFVMQSSLSDFYVEYQVNGYLEDTHARLRVRADLHRNIQDTFNEYGVQILSPHYENDPTVGPAMVPKSKWYQAPAKPPESPDSPGE